MLRLTVVASACIGGILFVAFVASRLARSRRVGLSIRMQFFLALAGIVGAFALGLGIMVMDRVQARAVRFATQAASDEARSIAGLLSGRLRRGATELAGLASELASEPPRSSQTAWKLLDRGGRVLFERNPPLMETGPVVTETAPLRLGGAELGRVEVVKPTVVMERLLRDFAPTVLVISLVLGAAAALAAAWMGRSIAVPIEALSRFSERVSRGEQGAQPPPEPWGREVVRLTHSIDAMRRMLEGRPFAQMFAADLSHELKNPVAAIRASAEVLEQGALSEPGRARHFVARIRQAASRIERLLGDLLHLARMEAGAATALETLQLSELLSVSLESARDRSRVRVRGAPAGSVYGEATWLGRAIGNLLDNAMLHSPPGSEVWVSACVEQGDAVLTVRNQGQVSKHVRQNPFRRFVSTRHDKGGTGLGLAIVRAVAEAHGGQASLLESGPPEVVFELRIPHARRH